VFRLLRKQEASGVIQVGGPAGGIPAGVVRLLRKQEASGAIPVGGSVGEKALVVEERAGEQVGELAGEEALVAGERAGELAGELAGESAGELAGKLAGERAGERAGGEAGEEALVVGGAATAHGLHRTAGGDGSDSDNTGGEEEADGADVTDDERGVLRHR